MVAIKREKISSTPMIELNYDLSKGDKQRIPKDLAGAVVRVNITAQKGEFSKADISVLLERIGRAKPALVVLGHVRTLAEDTSRQEKQLPVELTGQELVETFGNKFAPKENKKAIIGELTDIVQTVAEAKNESK